MGTKVKLGWLVGLGEMGLVVWKMVMEKPLEWRSVARCNMGFMWPWNGAGKRRRRRLGFGLGWGTGVGAIGFRCDEGCLFVLGQWKWEEIGVYSSV